MTKITAFVAIYSDAESTDDPELEKFLTQARAALPGFAVVRNKAKLDRVISDVNPDYKQVVVASRVFNSS